MRHIELKMIQYQINKHNQSQDTREIPGTCLKFIMKT